MAYPFDPYKIKVLDPIKILSKKERIRTLQEADYNLFKIPSEKVTIDLLTDSGTSALSQEQFSQMMLGDESYASAKSWERFEAAVKNFTGKKEVIPVHQGRAAEKIIAEVLLDRNDVAFSNSFFDTTRANFEHRGATCLDIPTEKSADLSKPRLFKGDLDTKKLGKLLSRFGQRAKFVLMTLTNNTGGGQPASLKNTELAGAMAIKQGLKFIIDACRIAENAYFIWLHEQKRKGDIKSIIRKLFSLADIAYMSTKKDGLANSGGFIVTNDRSLAAKLRELTVLYEGFVTYGGMTGREMETIARGLEEVTSPTYLEHRIGQTAYLHGGLAKLGVPLMHPPGGHAVYIDASKLFSHIPPNEFPGQALAVALYQESGIRSVEIGSLMLGKTSKPELVRLAIPRRTYTQSHFDYVIEAFKKIISHKKQYKGFKIIWQSPTLRHFTCKLKPK
ncbi:MAG: tryptophanase [Parcubacteria group bacterium Gr01-1014_44]|nr:MAG: tryptophanase [Parcubacteria group bacterium Gr01-1014_44]